MLSYTTMATPGLKIEEEIDAAVRFGFDGIDFRVKNKICDGEISETMTEEEAEALKAQLKEIKIPGILCYNEKLRAGHDAMAQSVLNCLNLAKMIDAESIRIFTGRLTSEKEMAELKAVFKDILAEDKSNIKIAMQNHVNNGVTVKQALNICNQIGDDRICLLFSPEQAIINGENFESLLPEIAKICSQIYIADIDRSNNFVLTGDGCINFESIMDRLYQHGFDGFVTLKWEKCWHPELPEYQKAFSSFFDWAHCYFGR